jgi:hypothetical protein
MLRDRLADRSRSGRAERGSARSGNSLTQQATAPMWPTTLKGYPIRSLHDRTWSFAFCSTPSWSVGGIAIAPSRANCYASAATLARRRPGWIYNLPLRFYDDSHARRCGAWSGRRHIDQRIYDDGALPAAAASGRPPRRRRSGAPEAPRDGGDRRPVRALRRALSLRLAGAASAAALSMAISPLRPALSLD